MHIHFLASRLAVLTGIAFIVTTAPAEAYIGPGAGLGAIALTIALVVGVVLLLVGFLWFPLKRLLRGRKEKPDSPSSDT